MKNLSITQMKAKIILTALILFFGLSGIMAQDETMYIMKDGDIVGQYNVNTDVDSVIFYAPPGITFTDSRDGTVYRTTTIGDQVWMAENLRYLPSVVGPATGSETNPYYYVYDYDGTNVTDAKATDDYKTYGVLYNFPAAMAGSPYSSTNPSGVQGVCPAGWHLPSNDEWVELMNYVGTASGEKLKETGTAHWSSPNTDATNETGFTALPGGFRHNNQTFINIGTNGYWWTTTNSGNNRAGSRVMSYDSSDVTFSSNMRDLAFSVRCVQD